MLAPVPRMRSNSSSCLIGIPFSAWLGIDGLSRRAVATASRCSAHRSMPTCAEALDEYRPPTDVQAALTTVGRVHGLRDGSESIDLVEAHLERAQLPDANLNDAILINSYLTQAHLYRAKLQRAELFGPDLTGANLSHAVPVGAYLHSAILQGLTSSTQI